MSRYFAVRSSSKSSWKKRFSRSYAAARDANRANISSVRSDSRGLCWRTETIDEKSERPSIGIVFEAVACELEFMFSFFSHSGNWVLRFRSSLRSSFVNDVERSFCSATEPRESSFGYDFANARLSSLRAQTQSDFLRT